MLHRDALLCAWQSADTCAALSEVSICGSPCVHTLWSCCLIPPSLQDYEEGSDFEVEGEPEAMDKKIHKFESLLQRLQQVVARMEESDMEVKGASCFSTSPRILACVWLWSCNGWAPFAAMPHCA